MATANQDYNCRIVAKSCTDNQTEECGRLQYATFTLGTLGHVVGIEETLIEVIKGLQRVNNLEKCDIILSYCSVTAIEQASMMLDTLPGNKPTVLIVLYYKRDQNWFEPDSTRTSKNRITVDCLLDEAHEVMKCPKNDKALSKIIKWLEEKETTRSESSNLNWSNKKLHFKENLLKSLPSRAIRCSSLNYFTMSSGTTLEVDMNIERKLREQNPGLQQVQDLGKSDLILFFCPVVSRSGTDIEEAMKLLCTSAGKKPAVLLVLHHTCDSNLIVPNSKTIVKRKNTIAVDCLFHEDEGFLTCSQNHSALSEVKNWLHHNRF